MTIQSFGSAQAWREWLEREHAASSGVWLRFAKKSTGIESVTYPEALDVALCYGWIDGQKKAADDGWWLQRFTPRTSRSIWSTVNRAKASDLIERGLMAPAGLREVERAKADGRWEAAYEPQRTASVPDDLAQALAANEAAQAFFATLDSRNRYAVLFRVHGAKRPETRARRIATFVEMLAEHRTIY